MGRARDLANFVSNSSGNVAFDTDTLFIDTTNDHVGIGGEPNKEFHVRDDNSFGGGTRIVAALSPSITNGQDAGLAFGTYSPDDYWKQGIFWERTGSYGLGHLHFANRGTADTTTVSKSDAKMTILANGSVTMPNQPGFQASGNFGWTDYGSTYTVVTNWRTTQPGFHNVGGHFNHNTGVFTCPVAGRYLVNIVAFVNDSGDSEHQGRIGLNGSFWGDNLITYTNSDTNYPDNTMGAGYIVNASANDTLTYHHREDLYGYHTSWSVHLLG